MPLYYLDTSALVKMVKEEPGSAAFQDLWLSGAEFASSILTKTELLRAVRFGGDAATCQARATLEAVDLLPLDNFIAETAAGLAPAILRSLDAIHVASALALIPDLAAVVTYDTRMADAARLAALPVLAPGTT
ncbi:MAG: type II toxin-antitoxin system VapC family toxin [Propionibacteriaceae bacterium]|jgi:predicted nucleic acid-binding protein|nr:type II toxin-antitoxin system VapC family toxin [Propionibacteriaceae bacterium]